MNDPLWRQLLLQLVLILVNAFFACTEIAVLSLNEGRLRRQMEEGDKVAPKMLKLVAEPSGFLSTIQIGITLAGFLASAFAASSFADRLVNWLVGSCGWKINEATLHTICVIAVTLILSYFMLVLGELVPKRIAMSNPDKVARFTCGVIIFLSIIFRPVVWLMSVSTNGVLRLFGINPNDTGETVSEDEIRLMIDIGEEKGTIESAEKEYIENIFEFNNTTAADVMVHRTDMVIIWADDTERQIIDTITESGLSRFPVCRDDADDVIGVLRTREYLLNLQASDKKSLTELLQEPYFVPETVRTDVLFRDMQARKTHMSIVIDEYGGISGLVTMEDLLEEIVGNIFDESDPKEEQEINRIGDGMWRIAGSTPLEDINEALDVELDTDEEYDTLGGLIFSRLSYIPADGSTPELTVDNLSIKVEELIERRVEWAVVTKLSTSEEE